MGRRRIAIGVIVASVGGFAITKLADAFHLGPLVVAGAFMCLIAGLLLVQLGHQPGPAGPTHQSH